MRQAKKICSFFVILGLLLFANPAPSQANDCFDCVTTCSAKEQICSTVGVWVCSTMAPTAVGAIPALVCSTVTILTCMYIGGKCTKQCAKSPACS